MLHPNLHGLSARFLKSYKITQNNSIGTGLCLTILLFALASCGSAAAGQTNTVTTTPTIALSPTTVPTHVLTPIPTHKPTPAPTIVPQPTQPPVSAQAILDLRPLSMSIVGHLDCQKNGVFVCFARVLSSSSNQSNLHWSAFTNVPGNIGFSPVSGVLTSGQSVLITITIPFNACTPGLFFFRGPVNTHTITWAC
jgi:hypothetical protein